MSKKKKRKLNIPRLVMAGTGLVLLLAIGIFAIILIGAKTKLTDQSIAIRWSDDKDFAQNSLYISTREAVDNKIVEHLRSEIEAGYKKSSIEASFEPMADQPANLMDSYAAFGTLSLSTDIRKAVTFDVIGVGGDFFKFHPVYLKSGSYFSEDFLMQDYVLLDEEAAWALFGSSDVAGMNVMCGETKLYVAGVYAREQSEIDKLAQGNEDPKVFVSYPVLKELDQNAKITVYELLGPNPIPHASYNVLKDIKLFAVDNVKILENSNRFTYAHYFELLKERKSRAMRTDDIGYPYWENVARYKEGQLMYVALWQWILAAVLFVLVFVNLTAFIVKHKPTKKTFEKLVDSVREKKRKERYEAQRQKLIEEQFGPDPEVEDEPIIEVKQIGESSADTMVENAEGAQAAESTGSANVATESEDGTDLEAAVVGATMAMVAGAKKEAEKSADAAENAENTEDTVQTVDEEIPEDSVDLRLKEVKTEDSKPAEEVKEAGSTGDNVEDTSDEVKEESKPEGETNEE